MGLRADLMLVGEHKLFRECLASTLADLERFTVTVQADDPAAALEAESEAQPDVLLFDLAAPTGRALQQIRELRARRPDLRVIVVGLPVEEEEVLRCIEAGANGYVLKESSIDELVAAIDQVLEGGVAGCTPAMARTLFARLAELAAERRQLNRIASLDLTPREQEILELIADGMSNKQIADHLCLSLHTVKNHVHHILDKLQVRRRSQAVEKAYRHHWLAARNERPVFKRSLQGA